METKQNNKVTENLEQKVPPVVKPSPIEVFKKTISGFLGTIKTKILAVPPINKIYVLLKKITKKHVRTVVFGFAAILLVFIILRVLLVNQVVRLNVFDPVPVDKPITGHKPSIYATDPVILEIESKSIEIGEALDSVELKKAELREPGYDFEIDFDK